MKLRLTLILLLTLAAALSSNVAAEDTPVDRAEVPQTGDALRLKLSEIQATEADLQVRKGVLEEDLKPENIERSLAGIGSTKPEELRESRRRQLTIELEGLQKKLKILATTRARLEAALQVADTEAYQQSAQGPRVPVTASLNADSPRSRWFVVSAAAVGLLAIVLGLALIRRFATT